MLVEPILWFFYETASGITEMIQILVKPDGVPFLYVLERCRYENDVPEKWYICQV